MKKSKLTTAIGILSLLASPSFADDAPKKLDQIVVTANPFGHSENELIRPVSVLSGKELLNKSQTTIGETISGELGVRSTYFGPNASRPVIRGLDGDNIQILQNGVVSLDASAASVDHNVVIDPLSVEKIEVVRGPSALLYGSKAIGGVVNVIDNRIPNSPISEKIIGAVDGRLNSANEERSGSLLLEGGVGKYAWHVNGFGRATNDIRIPEFAHSKSLRQSDPSNPEPRNRVPNSQSTSQGGSVGVSRFFDKGYFGLAATHYQTDYGTVAEPDVTIEMQQQRLDFAGSYKQPIQGIKEASFKLGLSDYEHTEFEGSSPGTVFKNRGYDSRLELVHNKFGLFEGTVGAQSSLSDFSALGSEAFLPPTKTKINSGFILEEIPLGKVRLQFGGRVDYQTVESKISSNFTTVNSRDDMTKSGSTGILYHPIKGYAISLSGAYTERAPNAQELYAKGSHVATNSFETGKKDLKVQKSTGLDLSIRKEEGALTGEVNFFYNRFKNYITLVANGQNDPDDKLPMYDYLNLDADFYGAEAKANLIAYDKNLQKLSFEIRSDYVEAKDRVTKQYLPRVAPLRIGASTIYHYEKVGLRLDADYNFKQGKLASNETPTDGYTMLNAGADYALDFGQTSSTLYLKATNLLDQEARNHVSFLKDSAPLSGRSIMIGIKTLF